MIFESKGWDNRQNFAPLQLFTGLIRVYIENSFSPSEIRKKNICEWFKGVSLKNSPFPGLFTLQSAIKHYFFMTCLYLWMIQSKAYAVLYIWVHSNVAYSSAEIVIGNKGMKLPSTTFLTPSHLLVCMQSVPYLTQMWFTVLISTSNYWVQISFVPFNHFRIPSSVLTTRHITIVC